ncbi:DUF5412 family protein [Aquibacillus kalidii]|uniref:DUF5412 family protein n=1 Tax=Aquibacillus kalidii TaxID=2762597 RepID=UPI001F35B73B|nr:DUF5412 family protein [Aquibacillus kalidii]
MAKHYNIWSFCICLVCLIFSFSLFFSAWTIFPPYVPWSLAMLAFILGIMGFEDKRNKISKLRSWFTVVSSILLLIPLSFVLLLGSLRPLFVSEELIKTSHSPDENYTIEFYLTNGGATTAFGVIGKLDGPLWFEKAIYDDYRMQYAEVEWINNHTVSINGHVLDLKRGETFFD